MSPRINPALITKAGNSNADRLKAIAKNNGIMPDKMIQRFGLEGAIRRVFQSDFADRFGMTAGLKGGTLMFLSEGVAPIKGRATKDIDVQLNGFTGTMEELVAIMRQVLAHVPAIDDGVRFDVDKLEVTATREGGIPGGTISTDLQVGGSHARFKMDVGFYDHDFVETLVETDYPSILPNMPPIRIYRQPVAFSICDKVHAAVAHSGTNSRMRDYYDIYVMLTKCTITDEQLRDAFAKSWPLYGAEIPASVDNMKSCGDNFAIKNAKTWRALRAESPWAVEAPELLDIVRLIRQRLAPVLGTAPTRKAA